jgi:hypothetical protein
MSTLHHPHSCHINFRTIAIIKFWTSLFCHLKKITLNHALLKLSQVSNEKIFVCNFYLLVLYVLLITLFDIHFSFLLQIETFIS